MAWGGVGWAINVHVHLPIHLPHTGCYVVRFLLNLNTLDATLYDLLWQLNTHLMLCRTISCASVFFRHFRVCLICLLVWLFQFERFRFSVGDGARWRFHEQMGSSAAQVGCSLSFCANAGRKIRISFRTLSGQKRISTTFSTCPPRTSSALPFCSWRLRRTWTDWKDVIVIFEDFVLHVWSSLDFFPAKHFPKMFARKLFLLGVVCFHIAESLDGRQKWLYLALLKCFSDLFLKAWWIRDMPIHIDHGRLSPDSMKA